MWSKISFFLLLFFINYCTAAQKLDSLLKELNNYKKEDTVKLKLLQSIARFYENGNPVEGVKMCDAAIILAQKLNRPIGLAYSYALKGKILIGLSQYPPAIEACQKSIDIAEPAAYKGILSMSYINMGNGYFYSANYPRSLEYYQKALDINEQFGEEQSIADISVNIGSDYEALSNYPKALEYYQKAQSIFEKLGNKDHLAGVLLNTGLVYYRLVNYPKALEYYQKALIIDEELKNKSGIASDLTFIGGLYGNLSDSKMALEYLQKSLALSEELGDKVLISDALGNIAACYSDLSDYPKALEYYQKAFKISEAIGNKDVMSSNLVDMGIIYAQLADYDKALQYQNKALSFSKETGNKRAEAENLNSIGTVYSNMAQYPKAIDYFQQALMINEELGIKDAINLKSLGNSYTALFEYSKALPYFQRSLLISEESGDAKISAENYCGIGIVYSNINDSILTKPGTAAAVGSSKAMSYFTRSLDTATKYGILDVQRNTWERLSIVYENQKEYARSMEAYKHFIIIRDSMVNDKKKKEITRLEFQFEFDKKRDSLNLQQQVTDIKLTEQILLARQQQQQLALNQKELTLSNKEKDLQKIAYLKTQADLQNEQLERNGKEKQLTISEKEKQLQVANVKTLTQENHLVALKQQQLWLYITGGLILLGFVSFWLFYRSRLQQVRLKTEMAAGKMEQQQKETEFQRQLGDISLSALRSQMNPHFIFNCLNSIKLYTTQNDTMAASEYLTKFSRLIRIVLENSRNDRITLASELDALRLYMEMEAMRFKEKLGYNIFVEKNVDVDYIEIPPLLLQPYVENAIWHGLMQKEEGGRIDVNVGMEHAESMLVINIKDNGIGRAKSAELMSKTATKHKSYGMKVTSERLALINRVYKTGANVTITDLADAYGQPSGTQVTIKIPLE